METEPPSTLARTEGAGGELVLRRRGTGSAAVTELIVDGVFAMDSAETSSERVLAECALLAGTPVTSVLVGGLGLGFTAAHLLAVAPELRRLEVAELEPALVAWAREDLLPTSAALRDPRVRLRVVDVAAVLTERTAARFEAVLLDVDNGPDFLLHHRNAALYGDPLLRAAVGRLVPGGVLAIWCQGESEPLAAGLARVAERTDVRTVEVQRGRHAIRYAIHLAWAAAAPVPDASDEPAAPGPPVPTR